MKRFRVVFETGAPIEGDRRVTSSEGGADQEDVAAQNAAFVLVDEQAANALAQAPGVVSVEEVREAPAR